MVSTPSSPSSLPVAQVIKSRCEIKLRPGLIAATVASNPALPFSAYPPATISGDNRAGGTAQLTFADSTSTEKYLQIYYGLDNYAVPINADKTVLIPGDIQGTAYA